MHYVLGVDKEHDRARLSPVNHVLRPTDHPGDVSSQSWRNCGLFTQFPYTCQPCSQPLLPPAPTYQEFPQGLPQETAKSLVNCFVVSRFDYCNSLHAGVPQVTLDRLQSVMNAAARMLCTVGRRARVSDLLGNGLHLLRVPQKIQL